MFIMSAVAHLHSPSHSSRYLCGLFIVGIINFLVCLLAFLVDVLLFVPHIAWGSWLVLAATVLVFLSFIVSCAMRRTLVGRKARKKRIAENAEMSGENYYNRQAQQEVVASGAASSLQPTVPSIHGANGRVDGLATFTSFEKQDGASSDERIPLTARTPSERSPSQRPIETSASNLSNNARSMSGSTRSASRDPYGNPINQPVDAYGMRRPSADRMNSRGRGGPPHRGRGGQGRGGYGGGYGPPPNGRGGYGPPGRGGYGPGPSGRGGYGPRGGPNGGMRGGRGPPPGYPGGAAYDRRAPPPQGPPGGYGGYGSEMPPVPSGGAYEANSSVPSIVPSSGTNTRGFDAYNPVQTDDLPRAESPPPLPGSDEQMSVLPGQAMEMDARTGSPAHPPAGFSQFGQGNGHLRDSDTDVAGMLALQESRSPSMQRTEVMSEGSKYSQDV